MIGTQFYPVMLAGSLVISSGGLLTMIGILFYKSLRCRLALESLALEDFVVISGTQFYRSRWWQRLQWFPYMTWSFAYIMCCCRLSGRPSYFFHPF